VAACRCSLADSFGPLQASWQPALEHAWCVVERQCEAVARLASALLARSGSTHRDLLQHAGERDQHRLAAAAASGQEQLGQHGAAQLLPMVDPTDFAGAPRAVPARTAVGGGDGGAAAPFEPPLAQRDAADSDSGSADDIVVVMQMQTVALADADGGVEASAAPQAKGDQRTVGLVALGSEKVPQGPRPRL
jgi:hypothetical protein